MSHVAFFVREKACERKNDNKKVCVCTSVYLRGGCVVAPSILPLMSPRFKCCFWVNFSTASGDNGPAYIFLNSRKFPAWGVKQNIVIYGKS